MHYQFEPTTFETTLGPHAPVLELADGDRVSTRTLCARGFDRDGGQRCPGGNPQTGPFHVRGAGPGDALEVRFERIWPNRDRGWSGRRVAAHILDPGYVTTLHAGAGPGWCDWRLDRDRGVASPVPGGALPASLALPFDPMLGCFGVAPAGGQAISTATSGPHGGNMDWRGFRAGTTVWLPVAVEGALFFLGDGHAVQGDGEVIGTGIETSMDVTFAVHVRKGWSLGWPRGEDAAVLFTVGNARPLDQALQHATTEMLKWLQSDLGLPGEAASQLLGLAGGYQIGNVFDPAYTVICTVPKRWLPEFGAAQFTGGTGAAGSGRT